MRRTSRRFRKWLINIAITGAAIAVTDATLAQLFSNLSDTCEPQFNKARIPSPIYHHDLAKNIRLDDAWGERHYSFNTNSLGFRDAVSRSVSPTPKAKRILFIGDSFTEGVGVAFEDSFVGLIGKRLGPEGIEVLNAAVVSYSPAIYYRKVKYILEKAHILFDHLVVFLDISDIQDEAEFYWIDDDDRVRSTERAEIWWHPTRRRDQPLTRLRNFLKSNSILFCFGDLSKSVLKAKFVHEPVTGKERGLWTIDDELYAKYGEKGLRRAADHMDRLLNTVRKHGIDLTLVVYPWPDQIVNRDLNSRQVRYWQAWASERDVGFIDLFPAFISDEDGEATIRKYFIAGDVHWNEAGHRRVAGSFLRHYEQRARQGH